MAYKSKFKGKEIDDKLDLVQKLSEDISDIKEDIKNIVHEETDPVFSNSPAADITDQDKTTWNNKQDNIKDLEDIRAGASKGKTAVQPSSLAKVATSGSYTDLNNKPRIPAEVTEATVSSWGFTKNTGTYSKPASGIPKTDLASDVQTSLSKAETALQSYTEQYQGTVTGVKINGSTKNPSNGVVDLGTVITEHQDISGKQDKITDLANIRSGAGKGDTSVQRLIVGNKQLTPDNKGNITLPQIPVETDITNMGFTKNKGTVTGVRVNGQSKLPDSSGIVDLGSIEGGGEGEVQNPSILASQIFLEFHSVSGDFQVFSHKSGYEEHNREVCQRLIENCFDNKTPNDEVFFVTINGLRDGVPYMETAILESQSSELVRASFVKGNIASESSVAASIGILSIDAEALRSYTEFGEDLFYWKYTSTLVPSIDAIDSGGESDVYVTEFAFEHITTNGTAVGVSPELVNAICNNRIIVIPSRRANFIATNIYSATPNSAVNVQMQIVEGTYIYNVSLSAKGPAPQTVLPSVRMTNLLSGRLNTINGMPLAQGSDMQLVSSISLNGKRYMPKKGAVDLGEIEVDEVKFANDLTGVIEATPEMFTYRPSAGDKSVRDESAVIRRIKGNTSVWNNIVNITGETAIVEVIPRGYRLTPNKTSATLGSPNWSSGWCRICKKQDILASHKHLIIMTYTRVAKRTDVEDFTPANARLYWDAGGHEYNIQDNIPTTIVLFGQPDPSNQYITLNDCIVDITDIIICDLTKLFGEGNEPTTLSEFYAGIPSETDIFLYNYGAIIPTRATGIETVGFNQWDEQWEVVNNTYIKSANYIKVLPNTEYYINVDCFNGVYFYDDRFTKINTIYPRKGIFTTPSNTAYMIFAPSDAYGTVYNNDICINLSHSGVRNGEYESYEKNTLLLPEIAKYFPNGMHSIGDVYDEITIDRVIKRCATRAYEEGDENNAEVKTDNITTVYKLSEPIYTPIEEPLQLDYKVNDFGTEKMLSDVPSAPFKADIVYQFNAEGRIRDNSRNIEKLEELVKVSVEDVNKTLDEKFTIPDKVIDPTTGINGYYNPGASTKKFTTTTAFKTIVTKTSSGEKYSYQSVVGGASMAAIILFDKDGNNIGVYAQGGNDIYGTILSGDIIIPDNAAELAFCSRAAAGDVYSLVKIGGIVSIVAIDNKISELEEYIFSAITTTLNTPV